MIIIVVIIIITTLSLSILLLLLVHFRPFPDGEGGRPSAAGEGSAACR